MTLLTVEWRLATTILTCIDAANMSPATRRDVQETSYAASSSKRTTATLIRLKTAADFGRVFHQHDVSRGRGGEERVERGSLCGMDTMQLAPQMLIPATIPARSSVVGVIVAVLHRRVPSGASIAVSGFACAVSGPNLPKSVGVIRFTSPNDQPTDRPKVATTLLYSTTTLV